ncbi:hypothetical protein A2773_04915 [Candidatus Gottesmanbacteria bacterium RIFCSPHIGHO2_01_FULL_39_10]|uniref:phosphoserine transaminase n=1 Tax=Candidatus Gottesmanbacteria bacterium RIFCSPHIGHO2_01_FULL_39_10 TaxID=1798375 RepID=A0A1F5ZSW1_9BACT|nr:MAG: hypothetical protein A2773_04915 [Candidatus Gottesmanbacteria bacterium RIFCSPHIGHO2_01_FULL_39_10]
MKKIFFTPGPSQLYPTVPGHIKRSLENNISSISHRSDTFHAIFEDSVSSFKKLYSIPKENYVFFLSSATECMERIIENLVVKKSLHFVNGSFSNLFFSISASLGIDAHKIEEPMGSGFNIENAKVPPGIELACFTQNETSTGVATPLKDIYHFKKINPNTVIALDIVSCAPYPDVDFSIIDCVFFSVQKGFGLPAGLGILVIKPDVLERLKYVKKKKTTLGSYHTFENLLKYYQKSETPETPNVFYIYLFGQICKDFQKVGLHKIRKDTENKSQLIYDLEKNKSFSPFVQEDRLRSKTTIVLNVKNGSKSLILSLKKKGLVVGGGYRELKEKQIRIANFPAHSITDVKKLLFAIQSFRN